MADSAHKYPHTKGVQNVPTIMTVISTFKSWKERQCSTKTKSTFSLAWCQSDAFLSNLFYSTVFQRFLEIGIVAQVPRGASGRKKKTGGETAVYANYSRADIVIYTVHYCCPIAKTSTFQGAVPRRIAPQFLISVPNFPRSFCHPSPIWIF